MPPKKVKPQDDLQADQNLKRIDDLESFREEFQGKEFDKKVLASIEDSHPIREELKKIFWEAIQSKLGWIVGTALLLMFSGAIRNLITNLIDKI